MKIKFSIFFLLFFLSFNINAGQKKIETIIANGIGTSIQDAAQNAAENALTQAVGSFIDATTMMEKQTVITDGVVSRSKIINKDIKEYSQGSIQYFEILDTKQTSGIFRITARVDVRIEDFRAYIKELATDTQEISAAINFIPTQNKTNQDNEEGRLSLLVDKILLPIMAGLVHNIELQSPIPFSQFKKTCKSKKYVAHFLDGSPSQRDCSYLPDSVNQSEVIVFPFTISLKDEFVDNMTNIFENISNSKQERYGINDIASGFNPRRPPIEKFIIINNKNDNLRSTIYTLDNYETEMEDYMMKRFPEIWAKKQFKSDWDKDLQPEYYWDSYEECRFGADLNIELLDENLDVLFKRALKTCYERGYGGWAGYVKLPTALASDGARHTSLQFPKFNLYSQQNNNRRNRYQGDHTNVSNHKTFFLQQQFYILEQLNPIVLQKAKSVKMFFTNNQ